MFIIWGTRKFNKILGVKEDCCPYCTVSGFTYLRTMTWFTLFFIPLFPVHKMYSRVCNSCGQMEKLKKAKFFEELNKSPEERTVRQEDIFEGAVESGLMQAGEAASRDITIIRKKKFVGCAMKINIHKNNSVVATLKNGQTTSFSAEDGCNLFATSGSGQHMLRSNVIRLGRDCAGNTFCVEAGTGKLKLYASENNGKPQTTDDIK